MCCCCCARCFIIKEFLCVSLGPHVRQHKASKINEHRPSAASAAVFCVLALASFLPTLCFLLITSRDSSRRKCCCEIKKNIRRNRERVFGYAAAQQTSLTLFGRLMVLRAAWTDHQQHWHGNSSAEEGRR